MTTKTEQEYNQDFYAWAIHNAQLLRDRKLSEVDIDHVAEEIESMGKSERRELINQLAILLSHLLKWQFQPERQGNSWKYTIKEQRIKLNQLLEDSPSLKYELIQKIEEAYEQATVIVLKETGIDENIFPVTCSFTLEQCLDHHFFP
jgi:hypothetical protein